MSLYILRLFVKKNDFYLLISEWATPFFILEPTSNGGKNLVKFSTFKGIFRTRITTWSQNCKHFFSRMCLAQEIYKKLSKNDPNSKNVYFLQFHAVFSGETLHGAIILTVLVLCCNCGSDDTLKWWKFDGKKITISSGLMNHKGVWPALKLKDKNHFFFTKSLKIYSDISYSKIFVFNNFL